MIEEFDQLYQQVYNELPGLADPIYHGSQIKNEFIEAWNTIIPIIEHTEDTFTFLEIGAYKGLWPLMLSFVCNSLNKKFEYTTITWMDQDPNNVDIFKVKTYYENNGLQFNLINKNSQLVSTVNELKNQYHCVFIDADHKYEGVKIDIELYSNFATKILMFHDIRPIDITPHCGVYQAIKDLGITLDKEIIYDGQKMGIGLKFISIDA